MSYSAVAEAGHNFFFLSKKNTVTNTKYIFTGRSQLLKNAGRTRGVYLTGSASNTSAYHTQIYCPPPAAAADGDESKLKLIFCTEKCFCGANEEAICYCCQNKAPAPVCYDQLSQCQANCPVCDPVCPPGTAAEGHRLHATKKNNAT